MNYFDLTISTGSNFQKTFTIKENGSPMNLTGYSASIYIVRSPGDPSTVVFSTTSGHITNGGVDGTLTLSLTPADIATINGDFYKLEIDNGSSQTEILVGNIFLLTEDKQGLEYLIPILRLQLGDTNSLSYRYLDEWLNVALISALKALQRWWGFRYLIDDVTNVITRGDFNFETDEPPVVQASDERPLILMASIMIKSGALEANSWNVGSWKDAEIAVSTIEGSRSKQFGLGLDWEELKMYILPPTKKLNIALRIPHPSTEE